MSTRTILAEDENGGAMSQGLLIAVLHHLGGSVDLPMSAVQQDVMGDAEGRLHSVSMEYLPDWRGIRLRIERVDNEESPR